MMRAETDKARLEALDLIAGFPGEALMREGLADFASGRCTIPSCLFDHVSVSDF